MITVEKALEILQNKTIHTTRHKELELSQSLGYVLSNDVISPIDMPPFPQSAMDGYAVNCLNKSGRFSLVGEIAAGEDKNEIILMENEAVRIFTGAKVPESANMVIQQEDALYQNGNVSFKVFPRVMANIRPKGEQIKRTEIALEKGHKINEASIGFLASIGVNKVNVYDEPNIVILSTGDELISIGEELKPGQIYESNSLMIQKALQAKGYQKATVIRIKDDYNETIEVIANCLENYDVIICSGGISVGDYDFVEKALLNNNVQTHFYKVKQKPGKPLYFGQRENAFVFGLPGNPAACLTGFYIYILPFLNKWQGGNFEGLRSHKGKLKSNYSRKGDRAEFLKGIVRDEVVEILEGQSSAMLQSYSQANALIYIPIERLIINAEEIVTYYQI